MVIFILARICSSSSATRLDSLGIITKPYKNHFWSMILKDTLYIAKNNCIIIFHTHVFRVFWWHNQSKFSLRNQKCFFYSFTVNTVNFQLYYILRNKDLTSQVCPCSRRPKASLNLFRKPKSWVFYQTCCSSCGITLTCRLLIICVNY